MNNYKYYPKHLYSKIDPSDANSIPKFVDILPTPVVAKPIEGNYSNI